MVEKHSSLGRVLGRLDSLDPVNLSNLAGRLARERGVFESIFNLLNEGVLLVGGDGIVEYANAAAGKLLGDEAGVTGRVLWRQAPELRGVLEEVLREGEVAPVFSREVRVSYPMERVLRLYVSPFKGAAVEERSFVVVVSDVTGERLDEEKRIEGERVASILLLAAGVAHELGNPLNSITIHLQLAERRLAKLKESEAVREVRKSVEVCRGEVARLDGIIGNFLNAIRPVAPVLKEVNLREVLVEVLALQGPELEAKGVGVEVEVPVDLPVVMGDEGQLKQVFFNVTKNAMEAMGEGGRLAVGARADDDYVYLCFADDGAGIRQEDAARLFEPYHTTKAEGSGLGLMIVERIMRAHGGQVGIESKEGVGTVVTLQFPKKNRRVRMLR